jgi:hypothetical protein
LALFVEMVARVLRAAQQVVAMQVLMLEADLR